MQSSQVRNVGLPSSAETKRDVPAWTQDPKIFPLDWFSVSRPNIIRQTKEYVSELSKWRNCPKIKTLSKLKAVLKRIMMFLHTHTSYIDGKSLLECDVEEDLITLVSLYMDMELRVLLIKKSTASGSTTSNAPRPRPESETDTARNDKLVADRISYWLYTVLTGHEQRVDALLSTTVYTRHTRPVLDPIFRKILNEMSDGPFNSVNYVRHMLAYKTWRERALVTDDTTSEELSARVQQHLVPRDYAFPPPLLRCLGKGDNARDHARPHNVNLADACRNFMRFCREMPCATAEQINFGSIPLLDDDMLGDEENEVNKLMNMITDRKQRKSVSLSPKRSSHQVDAFIDLTLPKSRNSRRGIPSTVTPDVIDLTEEDEKPVKNSRTSAAPEPPAAAPPRTAPAVQRISASKKAQSPQDCSYALAPSTRCFTSFCEQDIFLVNIACVCPREHRPRECQCPDKKVGYKENKTLKTSITERNYDKPFVGRCIQFSIGNQYQYPSEDDVDTEIQPLVIGNSQDQVKLEMRSSAAVTCNSNEDEAQDETTEFCDKLFSASLNHCDCDGCNRRDSNLSRYENRTCTSAESRGESENELSDISVQCKQKPLVTCTQRVSHPTSVADMYAMKKTSPIVLQSQPSTSWSEDDNRLEHFTETLDKRKINLSENNIVNKDNLILSEESLSSNSTNEIRKIKLSLIETETDDRLDTAGTILRSDDVSTASTNITPTKIHEEITESKNTVSPHTSEDKFVESTVITLNDSLESEKISVIHVQDHTESTNVTTATIHDKSTTQVSTADIISIIDAQNETSLDVSDTEADIECSESTNVSTVTLDKITPQVPQSAEIISVTNAQNETLLHLSDTRTEIEKLCSEITELGCSDVCDIDNVIRKDVTVKTINEDLLQDERSEETLDSVKEITSNVLQSEPVPEITAINVTESNLNKVFLKSLALDQDVNTQLIDTLVEETTEIIAESSNSRLEQSDIYQEQLEEENMNSEESVNIEEKSDNHVITKDNTGDEITNEIEFSHTEIQEDCMTPTNSTQVDLYEEKTPEVEIVIESEVVVESNSDISSNLPLLNMNNQLEYENTNTTELPVIVPDTEELHTDPIDTNVHIEQELLIIPKEKDVNVEQKLETIPVVTNDLVQNELHTVPIEKYDYTDISDVESKANNIRKVSLESDLQQKENSVESKNDTVNVRNLSPRKRRRRKANELTDEKVHEENCQTKYNIDNDVLDTSRRRKCLSLDEATNLNIFPEPESTVAIAPETTQEITVSATYEENTSANSKMLDLTVALSTDDNKPDDEISEQDAVTENAFNEQYSETEKPKRRRKQNLKDVIREDKAALTTTKDDKSTSLTQRKDKELLIVCKMLTRSEIELMRKNKIESENNIKSTTAEENENKIKPRKKNQMICDSTSNIIDETTPQPLELTEEENEQNKIKLTSRQKNLEDITSQLDNTSKEKEKPSKLKVKSKRKGQSIDNNVEKTVKQTTENQVKNSSLKTIEPIPDIKVKRSRGRPPKIVANKHKFFFENFNLQNLESKNNLIENIEINSVQETNASQNFEDTEEDMPLVYRMSQSLSQRKNSLKTSKLDTLSDVENKFNKSEDDLPLSTRKQKLKLSSTKNSKHAVFVKFDKNSEVTYKNNTKNMQNLKIQEAPTTKSQSFRNKLEQFKFQPKRKTESIQEEETFPLGKLNTGSKSNKSIKTYSNTKTTKTPELFSTPDIIQTTTVKPKKSIRFSDRITIIDIKSKNYYKTTISELEYQQLKATKADSNDSKKVEISLPRAKQIKIKKFREIQEDTPLLPADNLNTSVDTAETDVANISSTVQLFKDSENKSTESKNENLVIDIMITESENTSAAKSEVENISTENIIKSDTPTTVQPCTDNSEFVEEITDKFSSKEHERTMVEEEDFNNSSKTVASECKKIFTETNEVTIEAYTEPIKINTHLSLIPKNMLSKKAREKLLLTEMKNISDDKSQEITVIETCENNKDTSESKNICHTQNQENLSPENNELEQLQASLPVDNKPADIVNTLMPKSAVNIEQETSTTKQEEIILEASETNLKTDENEINSEISVTHQTPKIRKSKFPKLKLKMNNINNLFLSNKLRNNIKSLPKLKSRFGKKKKNKLQSQVNGSNDKPTKMLLSKVRRASKSTIKKSSRRTKTYNKTQHVKSVASNLHLEEDCKIMSSILPEHSVKFTGASKPTVAVVEPLEQISINNIFKEEPLCPDNVIIELKDTISLKELEEKKQNISEDITENIESAKIDDMLYKPDNKIYEKHFDFNSDQDDASNSELVIDTSAESSDAEEPTANKEIKDDKNDHVIQSQNTVSKQEKYNHSIAEIVNLNENNCSVSDTTIISSGDNNITQDHEVKAINLTTLNQLSSDNNIPEVIVDQNVEHQDNTVENQIDNKLDISTPNQVNIENTIEETSEKAFIFQDNTAVPQKSDMAEIFTSLSVLVVKENTVDETNIAKNSEVTEHHIDIIDDSKVDIVPEEHKTVLNAAEDLKLDTVSEEYTRIQNTAEELQEKVENKKIIHTAEVTEISEEIYNELHTESVIKEELQQLIEPFAPSVEMFVNIEVGFESCTLSQKRPIEGEHAKEGCVKCSVNGKHKDNKKITVRGVHQYKQNDVEEYLEESANIPDVSYCQVVESIEPNLCTLTANVVSVTVSTNESPDNYNLCILADIAMSSVHLNTKTENNNVIEIASDRSNEIHNQRPIQKDERCYFVTYPEKMPDSYKPTTSLSIINSNNEEISVNVQKLVGGINAKGTVLENKIQALTERAKHETKLNGDNLDELYKSLENICELQISTLTKTSPKSDNLPASIPIVDEPEVNPKIPEPNITIDIPNTAILHLTPDDDDFLNRSDPFSLQTPALQSLPLEIAPKAAPTENKELDGSGVVKNLFNVIESLTNNQKVNSENDNSDCNTTKEEELETKPKSKKGRTKSKSSNNHSSETSYLLNKYKSNHDSNKNVEINNQQNNSNNKNTPSPPSYIRSTRPMRMVTTRKRNVNVLENSCPPDEPVNKVKRNVNVLDNNCPPNEPVNKVSVSEKMFDKLLEEHRKELSEAKLKDETNDETSVKESTEISCVVKDATMPVLDVTVPETNLLCVPTTHAEEFNIPLPVLQYQMSESDLGKETITSDAEPTKLDIPVVNVEDSQKEDNYTEQISVETVQSSSLVNEISPIKEELHENTEINKLAETSEEKVTAKETIDNIEVKTHTEAEINKDKEEQIVEKEAQIATDRNATAIEVVQEWFNRVDVNKTQTEPYTEITYNQTIEECNFFEEISSTSENSPNVRKSDEKDFSEHQTPDSGIAFDEDSVQKDKLVESQTPVPENLSDGETYCTTEPETVTTKSYFSNLSGTETNKPKIKILDMQIIKPPLPDEENNMKLKVSIALERIQDILPTLTKQKINSPDRKMKKRKECTTDSEKGKKRKHSSEELHLNPVAVHDFNKTMLIDCKIKRRKHSNDDYVQEYIVEEVVSPAPSQKDIPSTIRTKGSVKEYPDCLFGITESPVPSGSFNSPYTSDISLTEEPTFYEEEGIDLCNDYPCYESFEVLQKEQSLQKDYSVVDDNPKDVQQGLQAGYYVVDSQFLPLSEYMNDGDYILFDNKLINDKMMVPVNMHEVQPEFKPHQEVKRSEFDDSEKEDSLSETVDEIIKNPNLFPEQSTSEVQVISMDQATSEVQVVIACDAYQETELTDTHLLGIASQNELISCETTSTSMVSDTHTSMDLEGATPESKVTDKPVDFKPATPAMGSENAKLCNTSVVPVADVPQPVSMELLTAVNSISKPVITQDIENNEELSNQINKKLRTENVKTDVKKEEKINKLCSQRLSSSKFNHLNVPTLKTPSYSASPTRTSPRIFQKPSYSKSLSNEPTVNGEEVLENKITKELEPKVHMSEKNHSASSITSSSYKDPKKYNYKHGTKIPNQKHPYPDQKPFKTYDSTIHSQYLSQSPNQKPTDPKMYPKPYYPKTYNSKVPIDAFDKLKQERTDISPPPDCRNRYSNSSSSNLNFMKTRNRKEMSPADFHRRHPSVRESPRTRHNSQLSSDSRRPQSAYSEPSPKTAYQLPPSDPTYRSSQYNCKKPDVKPSQSRHITEQSKHSQSSSSAQAQRDWLNNETLVNLIKKADTIYNKKY